MRKPFRGFLKDWPWRVAALGVALVVFLGIRHSVSYTQTLTLAVEAETVNGTQALTGFEPGVVSITFRGSEAAIRKLSVPGAEPPRIRVKLKQPSADAPSTMVTVSPRDVLRDDGLRVVAVSPNKVKAFFDTRDTRWFEVAEPIITGAPATGKVRVSIEPKRVEVTGSRSLLDEMEAAQTKLTPAILDVANRAEGFQTVLRVLPPDSRGGWTLKPETVRADVQFVREESVQERVFEQVPVEVLQSPDGARYRPLQRMVTVRVQGEKRELEAFKPESIRVVGGVPAQAIPDAEGAVWSELELFLPCTNRVTRATIDPAQMRFVRVRPREDEE